MEGEVVGPIPQAVSGFTKPYLSLLPETWRISRRKLIWSVLISILVLVPGVLLFNLIESTEGVPEPVPDEKHIVVLPFMNLSPDVIPASMSDGILEILTSKITQMEMHRESMWVVPSSEVRQHQVSSVSQASRLFGTNMAVTGSLFSEGNRFRLTLNLVDGSSLRQLRSSDLEIDWSDIALLQDEVVYALTRMLDIEMAPGDVKSIIAGGSENSRAYQLYIEGRGYLSRYEISENIESAILKFEESIEADSGFVRAYTGLSEAHWRMFDLTRNARWARDAIDYGQKATELDDCFPDVYNIMALVYNEMGRYQETLDLLEQLERRDALRYISLIQRARAYEGKGQLDQAEKAYHSAIDRKKTYWNGYNSLGVFYYRQGRLSEAAESFRKVAELTPDNARAFNNLGGTYLAMERVDEAMNAYNRSLEIQPNHLALTNLGTLHYYQKNYTEAIHFYEQALELTDSDHRIWGNLGFAYHWSGHDFEKVRSALQKAIVLAEEVREIRPNDPGLLSQLAGYHHTIGNQEQARILLRQLTSLEVLEPENYATIAHLYEQLGERDTALHWVAESLRKGYRIHTLDTIEGMQDLLDDPRMAELIEKYDSD
jgi:tetratricopeptide (TPR) repeat protein